jgi:hypothetical protein
MTYASAECTVESSWWWAEELPEHLEFLEKNKFGKISVSFGFIKKKLVTMHGHMNVKNVWKKFINKLKLLIMYFKWNIIKYM